MSAIELLSVGDRVRRRLGFALERSMRGIRGSSIRSLRGGEHHVPRQGRHDGVGDGEGGRPQGHRASPALRISRGELCHAAPGSSTHRCNKERRNWRSPDLALREGAIKDERISWKFLRRERTGFPHLFLFWSFSCSLSFWISACI
jgi:hypothetical protein